MNNQDIRGKKISVQQLTDEERDKFGYVINNRNTAAAGSFTLGQTVLVYIIMFSIWDLADNYTDFL